LLKVAWLPNLELLSFLALPSQSATGVSLINSPYQLEIQSRGVMSVDCVESY
jgi:hypothetical protein